MDRLRRARGTGRPLFYYFRKSSRAVTIYLEVVNLVAALPRYGSTHQIGIVAITT